MAGVVQALTELAMCADARLCVLPSKHLTVQLSGKVGCPQVSTWLSQGARPGPGNVWRHAQSLQATAIRLRLCAWRVTRSSHHIAHAAGLCHAVYRP